MEQCLCSVLKAVKNIEAEIFVVDNHSSDDSKSFFKDKFNVVTFIWNEKNYGFAKANNIALLLARGEYILFLNPDTILPEDCFSKCIAFLKSQSCTGALGVHMTDGSGKFLKESKRSFPSPTTSLYKLFGLTGLFPHSKTFAKYYLGNLDESVNHEVDVLAGAFIMLPKHIIHHTGGFDEAFFMYGEDIDLSFRIQKAGYKNFYFSDSSIIHFKGESTKKGSLNYIRVFYKAMSIFVKKHYGGSKAGAFNFLIQAAILFRAFVSATTRFIRRIGIPAVDAALILLSFWLVKFLWNTYIKQDVNYSSNLLIIAFPVFTLLFLAVSFFSGLYDNGYKQSRLNNSAIVAISTLLAIYSLLPESVRFSRGILVFGSVIAFGMMTVIRQLLLKMKVLDTNEDDESKQTIIVGTITEYISAATLLQYAGAKERILGRVEPNEKKTNAIGNVEQLLQLLNIYPVKEVILCEGNLSFRKIIELTKLIPRDVRIKFHASGSESIIGSDSKNIAGMYFTSHTNFKLATPVGKRNKGLADILVSVIFIISFPIHLLLQKKPFHFFKNVLAIFLRSNTWVGYAASSFAGLPVLKPGILSVTGYPVFMNTLPEENLIAADMWYATNYSFWHDVRLIYKNYKLLSV